METVLLAIEGDKPHRSVMSFAVQFCRRMHVALDILHVVRPEQDAYLSPGPCGIEEASEVESEGAPCADSHLLKTENPPIAIANYINTHRNIVLAIYDSWVGERNNHNETQAGDVPEGFEKPLAVPLVMMRA